MHSRFAIKSIKGTVLNYMMGMMVKKSYNENSYHEVYRNNRDLTSFERTAMCKFLRCIDSESPNILDMGCGTGKPYDEFLVKNKCRVTGLDYSKSHINLASKNVPQVKYVYANFLSYNYSEIYDGVIMLYSLFHVQRDYHQKLLQNIYNHLSAKGKILLNVRKEDSGDIKYKRNFCGKPMFWSHYDYKTFKKIVRSIGYRLTYLGDEKKHGSSESHIWLILEK